MVMNMNDSILKKCTLILLTIVSLAGFSAALAQVPGDLDSTFGSGGKVRILEICPCSIFTRSRRTVAVLDLESRDIPCYEIASLTSHLGSGDN